MTHKEKIELIREFGLVGIGIVFAGGLLYIIGKKVSETHVVSGEHTGCTEEEEEVQ